MWLKAERAIDPIHREARGRSASELGTYLEPPEQASWSAQFWRLSIAWMQCSLP
jgi:hypothetical protein